jgi:hypothetical protein
MGGATGPDGAAAATGTTRTATSPPQSSRRVMTWNLPPCAVRVKRPGVSGGMTVRMATSTKDKAGAEKDFVSRLADAGEEALQRIAELPGGQKALTAFNDLRTRVDELGKKVRGIDALEARVAKLEKELASLKKAKAPARGQAPRKPSP